EAPPRHAAHRLREASVGRRPHLVQEEERAELREAPEEELARRRVLRLDLREEIERRREVLAAALRHDFEELAGPGGLALMHAGTVEIPEERALHEAVTALDGRRLRD